MTHLLPPHAEEAIQAALQQVGDQLTTFAMHTLAIIINVIASVLDKLDQLVSTLPPNAEGWVRAATNDIRFKLALSKQALTIGCSLIMGFRNILQANLSPFMADAVLLILLAMTITTLMPVIMFAVWLVTIPYTVSAGAINLFSGLPPWAKLFIMLSVFIVIVAMNKSDA